MSEEPAETNAQAVIAAIVALAETGPADRLFERNAARLEPELYQRAASAFAGWDAALAAALVSLAAQPAARSTARARAPRPAADEPVVRRPGPQAAQRLFARTDGGAFYTLDPSEVPLSQAPLIPPTPQGAGRMAALRFIGEPNAVVVFSDRGRYFGMDARMVPQWDGDLQNRRVQDVLHLEAGEQIIEVVERDLLHDAAGYGAARKGGPNRLIHVTKFGKAKATEVSEMIYTLDREGRTAFLLNDEDAPVAVMVGAHQNSVFCASAMGKAIHFDAADIRSMGLQAVGVNAMKLAGDDDAIVGAFLGDGVEQVAIITEKGLGKRVDFGAFRPQSRAGGGLQLLKLQPGDRVACAVACKADEDLAIVTSRGRVHRVAATAFARLGRPAQGDPQIELIDEEVVVRLVALPCGGA